MKKIKAIENAHFAAIGLRESILTYLVSTPNPRDLHQLITEDWLDGLCIEDNSDFMDGFPNEPGFYAATLEFWHEQGYFEGYPANGENDIYVQLKNLRKLEVNDPKQ